MDGPCEEEDRRTGREGERERMGNDEGVGEGGGEERRWN